VLVTCVCACVRVCVCACACVRVQPLPVRLTGHKSSVRVILDVPALSGGDPRPCVVKTRMAL
jgi:hypothetical protein